MILILLLLCVIIDHDERRPELPKALHMQHKHKQQHNRDIAIALNITNVHIHDSPEYVVPLLGVLLRSRDNHIHASENIDHHIRVRF